MKKIFALLIILFVGQIGISQEASKAILFDEFGQPCSEVIAARLDNLTVELHKEPEMKIYILFYGGEMEGRNLTYLNYYRFYLTENRKINADRIIVLRGGNQQSMLTQFWLVPPGLEPPKPKSEFVELRAVTMTKFDESYPSFSGGFPEWGCADLNGEAFADFLLNNPNVIGHIVIFTKPGIGVKRADKTARLALRHLARLKVPRNRLKTVYGGSRKESEVELWLVEIELWLVPEGQKLLTRTKKATANFLEN